MEWQPIATAPKDWTHVILADKSGLIGEAYYQTEAEEWVLANMSADDEDAIVSKPTRWLPMPEPPK